MGVISFALKLIAVPIIFVLATVFIVYFVKKKRSVEDNEKGSAPAPALVPFNVNYHRELAEPPPVHLWHQYQQYQIAAADQVGTRMESQKAQVVFVEPNKVSVGAGGVEANPFSFFQDPIGRLLMLTGCLMFRFAHDVVSSWSNFTHQQRCLAPTPRGYARCKAVEWRRSL
jgi:hypothetical protein